MRWDLVTIILFLAVFMPWRGVLRMRAVRRLRNVDSSARARLYASTIVFQWLLVSITVWRALLRGWELRALGLGLPVSLRTVLFGLVPAAVLTVTQVIGVRKLRETPAAQGVMVDLTKKIMPQAASELPLFIALVCTVSICEEALYRGFAFTFFQVLFGGSLLAATLTSSALFAVGHLYQGRRGIASTFVAGLAFAALRVYTGTIVPCIITHFAVDLAAGMVCLSLAKEHATARTTV